MTELELMKTTVLGCRRADLYCDPPALTPRQAESLAGMQRRRRLGEPLQYILGECDFCGLALRVDPRVLIPRPETEILVDETLRRARARGPAEIRVLDLGTGSGNIAVSLAAFLNNCAVTAVDVSGAALTVARENARRHGVSDRVAFLQADLREFLARPPVDAPSGFFDIIVSNPPYIASSALSSLPADVRREPRLALDGGEDGLTFLRAIIADSPSRLTPGGLLLAEIGDGQRNFLEKWLENSDQFCDYGFVPDYVKTDRVLVAQTKPRSTTAVPRFQR
jgi:release factor glutamine methyltransferase